MKKNILPLFAVLALVFSSCSKDDTAVVEDINTVTAPDTYVFERNGETSVSFSGQTTRIAMAEEIITALKDPNFTEVQLDAMYNHIEGSEDFSNADLNASDKSVRGKTAASFDLFGSIANVEVTSDFDGWITEQVTNVYPVWEQEASAGVAGALQEANVVLFVI